MHNDFDKIDKLAKDTLRDYEMDFNPEDWTKMAARLDKKEHKMPKIFLLKGIEATLILLVLFTSVNLFYYKNEAKASNDNLNSLYSENQDNNINILNTEEQKLLQKQHTAEASKDKNNNDYLAVVNNTKNEKKSENQKNLTSFSKSSNNSAKNTTLISKPYSNSNNNRQIINNSKISNNNFNSNIANNNGSSIIIKGKNNLQANDEGPNDSQLSKSDLKYITEKESDESSLGLIRLATIQKIKKNNTNSDGQGDPVEEGKAYTLKNGFKFPKLYHRQLRAVAFAGADMNLANRIGNENVGFSFGVFMEYELSDRFALRSGILSSGKNFSKTYNTILDRTAEEGVIYFSKVDQKTGLSVFSIPVLLNGIILKNEKWCISASMGPALSLLTHRFVSGEKRTNMIQSSGNVTAITDLNPADFEKGLLQGAKAENNIFISAMLGFEVERHLGNRVSIFIQPMYNVGLSKVGEEKDRLQNISVNVGIKGVIK